MSNSDFELDDSQSGNKGGSNRREERNERRQDRDDRSHQAGGFTYDSIDTSNIRPSIGGISDQVLAVFTRAWEKTGEHEDPNLPAAYRRANFRFVPLSSNTGLTVNPVLVVAMNAEPVAGKKMALAYLLVFQKDQVLPTRILTDRGEQYASPIFPEDQLTDRYRKLVESQFPDRELIICGSQVITRRTVAQLSPDKEDLSQITPLIDNAFNALCGTYENILASSTGDRSIGARITPRSLTGKQRHEATYDFSGASIVDTSGLPIRSDITARLFLSTPNPDDDGNYNRLELTELRAGIDLYVSEEDDDDDRRGFGGRRRRRDRDEVRPFYQAVLNINSIVPSTPKIPFTLETVLLTLDLAARATDNLRWAAAFRPRPFSEPTAGNPDQLMKLPDFPRLNPDGGEKAARIENMPTHLSDSDLFEFLEAHVLPDVAVAMTVPSSGAYSWVLSLFSAMAQDPNDRNLVKILFDAADVVTGNAFSERAREYDLDNRPGDYFVRRINARMLVGDWTDSAGNIRSLAEWNPVALMSYLGKKRNAVDIALEYQDTFTNTTYTADHNLAKRIDILTRNVPVVNILGQADQIAFEPDFLKVLSLAIADAQMDPYISSGDGLLTRRIGGDLGYRSSASTNLGAASSRRDRRESSRGRSSYNLRDSKFF